MSKSFNSILVRLKAKTTEEADQAFSCFNSILVRLKDDAPIRVIPIFDGFNSILVRLKGLQILSFFALGLVSIPYWFD